MNGITPALTAEIMSLGNRVLPSAGGSNQERYRGKDSENAVSDSLLTKPGRIAAREMHQYPEHGLA
jgi:hypothetical protein